MDAHHTVGHQVRASRYACLLVLRVHWHLAESDDRRAHALEPDKHLSVSPVILYYGAAAPARRRPLQQFIAKATTNSNSPQTGRIGLAIGIGETGNRSALFTNLAGFSRSRSSSRSYMLVLVSHWLTSLPLASDLTGRFSQTYKTTRPTGMNGAIRTPRLASSSTSSSTASIP